MSEDIRTGPQPVSDKVAEQARTFLLGLFMGLRTAQIHETSNQAFEKAVVAVHQAAETLFKATGGFRIQFVDDTVFINGGRVRMDRSAFNTMRALKSYLEEQEIGGIGMSAPPSYNTVRSLVLGLASKDETRETAIGNDQLEFLGVQQLADENTEDIRVDRRVLAVQSYGKLLIATRELLDHAERGRTEAPRSRIRAVRVIQDIVELATDRADFILRLATNRGGVAIDELHGVNVAMVSIAMGTALGLPRSDLVDLGVTAIFHHVACRRNRHLGAVRLGEATTLASLCHLLFQSGAGDAAFRRATILAHHRRRDRDLTNANYERPNILARILGLATAYDQLASGFGTRDESAAHPLDVLQALYDDPSDRFDPNLVDLLINIFRAFPLGCEVVLDDGRHAVVDSHLGSSRWDRPIVKIVGSYDPVDLMQRSGPRFHARIRGTPRFTGRAERVGPHGLVAPPIAGDGPAPEVPQTAGSVDDMLRAFLDDQG